MVSPEVFNNIEAFTCIMYGYPNDTSINTVRSKMLRKMVGDDDKLNAKSKVDLTRLPPCRDNLVPHVQRVNHRLAHYKRARTPTYTSPHPCDPEQGWERTEEGLIEPVWSRGPLLPQSLIDILQQSSEEADSEQSDVQDFEYDPCDEDNMS